MKVKLTYEPVDLSWHNEKTLETQDSLSTEDVEALFKVYFGIIYNKYECFYEVIGEGKIYTMDEVFGYTE